MSEKDLNYRIIVKFGMILISLESSKVIFYLHGSRQIGLDCSKSDNVQNVFNFYILCSVNSEND